MKYLRLLLSVMAALAGISWSRLILPLRKERMPFSGWGDGSTGDVTTLAGPVLVVWFVTMLAFLFIGIKPHLRYESGWVRVVRWFANSILFLIAFVLLFYSRHGPPLRFLALCGFVTLIGLWLYLDLKGRKNGSTNLQP